MDILTLRDAADSYGKFAVNQSVDVKALGILPNQRQIGVKGEIVGDFFDNKVGHVILTFKVSPTCGISH